jgi:lipopolysaccharide/colanic/teichoic acid biosynthesis glycosyltransferase
MNVPELARCGRPAEAVRAGTAPSPRGLAAPVEKVIAVAMLLLTAPLMGVVAALIRFDSPGPVIFRQLRIGQGRRKGDRRAPAIPRTGDGAERRRGERRQDDLCGPPFRFYKFRTMRVDARRDFPQLYAQEVSEQVLSRLYLQVPDDPRVTRIGRFLRRTSLDELPNFYNVLRGDMGLVGPRPEMVEMAKYYHGEQRLKFTVKPGITGKAQVNGRGLLNFQDTVSLDVEYVRERSLANDLRLLVRTAVVMVKGTGAF